VGGAKRYPPFKPQQAMGIASLHPSYAEPLSAEEVRSLSDAPPISRTLSDACGVALCYYFGRTREHRRSPCLIPWCPVIASIM
jgi:hypothetical protein